MSSCASRTTAGRRGAGKARATCSRKCACNEALGEEFAKQRLARRPRRRRPAPARLDRATGLQPRQRRPAIPVRQRPRGARPQHRACGQAGLCRRAVPWPPAGLRAVPRTRPAPGRRQRASGQARGALPRRAADARLRLPHAARRAGGDPRRQRADGRPHAVRGRGSDRGIVRRCATAGRRRRRRWACRSRKPAPGYAALYGAIGGGVARPMPSARCRPATTPRCRRWATRSRSCTASTSSPRTPRA